MRISIAKTGTKRARCRLLPASIMPNKPRLRILPRNIGGIDIEFGVNGAIWLADVAAVVVMFSVVAMEALPFAMIDAGLKEQAAPVGKPVQLNVTVPLYPFLP